MKILVADDSNTFLTIIKASLKRLGHDFIGVNNAEDAIKAFKEEKPDLVILDVFMKGLDGFQCAAKIRKINPEDWVPIIFLSSSVEDESIAYGIASGGDDYLTKPYSEVVLQAKINAMQRIYEMKKRLSAMASKLQKLSSTDVLTNLYNRFQFEKSLAEQIASADRHKHNIALLFVDLDHFKSINDTYGHEIGDKLLREVAKRIRKCTRKDDIVSRIGGDEFTIILSHIEGHSDAAEVASKMVKIISEKYKIDGILIKISASIGIVCYPEQIKDPKVIVENADIAMYAAKQIGRNNYQFYTEVLNEKYHHQLSLENDLKFALERDELYLQYQPIYALLTQKIIGVESLLRWRHPKFGIVAPSIFIPIAEESRLIVDIGKWVLKEACSKGANFCKLHDGDFKIFINTSLFQFIEPNFSETVRDIVAATKMDPNNIELELTESTFINYTDNLKETMLALKNMGIGISIDDFGSRYSSLTSLKTLPVTTLKIDQVFVKNLHADEKNKIIVQSLIALGLHLGLDVIAEGIEQQEQLDFLIANGCQYGQGYLMNKPMDEQDIIKKIVSLKKGKRIRNV